VAVLALLRLCWLAWSEEAASLSGPSAVLKLPLAWVHVPKTGTSILNALMSLACDDGWAPVLAPGAAQHAFWRWHPMDRGCAHGFSSSPDVQSKTRAFRQTTGGLRAPGEWYESPAGHKGFGKHAPTHAPMGVTVLRQPEQRLLSGYLHNFHSLTCQCDRSLKLHRPSELWYAKAMRGCAVRLLTSKSVAPCETPTPRRPPSRAATMRAIETLRQFQFVGITEQWELTVCLWHRLYGGRKPTLFRAGRPWWAKCAASHFTNTRIGKGNKAGGASGYNASALLPDFVDERDGQLYHAGLRLFRSQLQRYGLSEETCEPCFAHARRTIGDAGGS
jgi:hypothetical protein